jgi:hypothetical protein
LLLHWSFRARVYCTSRQCRRSPGLRRESSSVVVVRQPMARCEDRDAFSGLATPSRVHLTQPCPSNFTCDVVLRRQQGVPYTPEVALSGKQSSCRRSLHRNRHCTRATRRRCLTRDHVPTGRVHLRRGEESLGCDFLRKKIQCMTV